jgi:site-specific recombinase XerC
LDHPGRRVTVSEKGGRIRTLPLAGWLITDLDRFSVDRGARTGGDPVFRYADGHPLTKRRFNTLFDRLDRHTTWSEELDVGAHWIRHTTLTDIAAVAGVRVAEAYAGHRTSNAPTIYRYTAVDLEDMSTAYEELFGVR